VTLSRELPFALIQFPLWEYLKVSSHSVIISGCSSAVVVLPKKKRLDAEVTVSLTSVYARRKPVGGDKTARAGLTNAGAMYRKNCGRLHTGSK